LLDSGVAAWRAGLWDHLAQLQLSRRFTFAAVARAPTGRRLQPRLRTRVDPGPGITLRHRDLVVRYHLGDFPAQARRIGASLARWRVSKSVVVTITRAAPDTTCELREVTIMPVICPTSQTIFL